MTIRVDWCLLRIAVPGSRVGLCVDPVVDGQSGGVDTADDTEAGERDVGDLLPSGLRAGSKVEHRL